MSAFGGKPENISLFRALLVLTHLRHRSARNPAAQQSPCVLFLSEAREVLGSETARFHHAAAWPFSALGCGPSTKRCDATALFQRHVEMRREREPRKGRSTMRSTPRLIVSLIVVEALTLPAVAQYPNKPITVIVPFPAAGPTDVVAPLPCANKYRTPGPPPISDKA